MNILIFLLSTLITLARAQSQDELNAHNARFRKGLETYETLTLLKNESINRYMGANFEDHVLHIKKHKVPIATLVDNIPMNWDIRINGPGNLTEVKNQGACSSSWIFASVAAVENRLSVRDGVLTSLSEQQMVDCVSKQSGCMGGWVINAFDYIKNTGLTTSAAYPYMGKYVICKEKTVQKNFSIKGYVQMENDPSMIKSTIMRQGACVMCVDANRWFGYLRGMFSNSLVTNENKKCNHLVALVGWGTHETNGRPYWLLKNSWGVNWGEDGYIRAAADKYGGCFMNLVFCPTV